LSSWGNVELEEIGLILPVVWEFSDLDVLLDRVSELNDLLVDGLALS